MSTLSPEKNLFRIQSFRFKLVKTSLVTYLFNKENNIAFFRNLESGMWFLSNYKPRHQYLLVMLFYSIANFGFQEAQKMALNDR